MTQTPEKGEQDGWAVFNGAGIPITWAIGATKTHAINSFIGRRYRHEKTRIWRKWKRKHGFSVRRVLITEIEE